MPSDMDRIKQYIMENYHDSSLNLTAIAQEFGYNPSYLSRRFKADCGHGKSKKMSGIPDAYVYDRKRSRHPGPQLFRKMFQKIYRKFVL